jgi:predicted RecB family nuclease
VERAYITFSGTLEVNVNDPNAIEAYRALTLGQYVSLSDILCTVEGKNFAPQTDKVTEQEILQERLTLKVHSYALDGPEPSTATFEVPEEDS